MATKSNSRPILLGKDQCQEEYYRGLIKQHGSPLLIFDAQQLKKQYQALQTALPNVELFYAIKAHPDAAIIEVLDQLGCGFDVASAGEMALLLEQKVSGRRTIHTHPIKKDQEIRDALRFGSTTFVVDNPHELKKLTQYRSRIGVLLRVGFRSESATVDLSKKFGCSPDEVTEIVSLAKQLGIHIKGLSFHVGSQCGNADKHVQAIQRCKELMEQVNQTQDRPMSVLDIGGGFPADYQMQDFDIDQFCEPIRAALAELPKDWNIIAEPGRYLVASSVVSVTTINGKSKRSGVHWYYLDDGVYGSYSGQIFDHAIYPLQAFAEGKTHTSILAGPTCDSIDVIAEQIQLPELEVGDLIIGHQMGAYTAATKTRFNLIPDAKLITVNC